MISALPPNAAPNAARLLQLKILLHLQHDNAKIRGQIKGRAQIKGADKGTGVLDLWDYDALGNMTSTSRVLLPMAGDANLDGTVTGDDYTRIDSNLGEEISWWRQGDMNLDSSTTGDDYGTASTSWRVIHYEVR